MFLLNTVNLYGYCSVRNSKNKDFSPLGTGIEGKTHPQTLWGRDRGRNICPGEFAEFAIILNFFYNSDYT
jgi:hypothetical protein